MRSNVSEIIKAGKIEPVSIMFIKVPEYHDRTDVDNDSIQALASNMDEMGQLTPIIVEKTPDGFNLISGLRRLEAAHKLDWTSIDAIILENVSEEERILIMITENAQRQSLNDYDLVVSLLHFLAVSVEKSDDEIKNFLYKLKNVKDGKTKELTIDEKKLKKSLEDSILKTNKYNLSSLSSKMKVLNFHPDIIQAMKEKKLLFSYASMLNKVKDEEKMKELLTAFVSGQIDKSELKKAIRQILNENKVVFPFENFIKNLKTSFNSFDEEKKKTIQEKIAELERVLTA